MNNQHPIKYFVKHVLGCTCPDKIFDQIEDRQIQSSSSPHTRSIMIGGKLLIYIWEVIGSEGIEHDLEAVLAAGKKERDARGLNRFRAVLAAEDSRALSARAHHNFTLFADRDERMHIHVVPSRLLPTT